MGEGEGGGTGGYCRRIGTSTLAIVVVYAPVFLFFLSFLSASLIGHTIHLLFLFYSTFQVLQRAISYVRSMSTLGNGENTVRRMDRNEGIVHFMYR